MSCFDELTYAIYADGELSDEQRVDVESHLMSCRACRELVVALGNEAELFGEVLHERLRTPVVVSEHAPARGMAIGLGPTLLAAAIVISALGWLLDTATPMASRWLGPFSPRGAYDMAFDVIFLLRDEAPGALAIATAIASMASASALLTFLLGALLRRFPGSGAYGLCLLLLVLALPTEGRAHFGFHEHDNFELAAGETHDGTLFISAEDADIDGVVEGDLVVFAHTLTVRGEVRGNVLAISRTYEQPGKVDGTVHVGAGRTHIGGEVTANLYAFSEDLTLADSARIGRDAAVAVDRGVIEGSIGRDLYAGGDQIELRGQVERHLRAHALRVALLDDAHVKGDLTTMLPEGKEVELSSGARVDGEASTNVRDDESQPRFGGWADARHWGLLVLHIAAGFLVAMLLHWLMPGFFASRVANAADFFRSLGVGFVVVVAAPCALILLALTLVGIPLSVIGLAFYLTSIYVGLLLVSFLVGTTLLDPGESWTSFGLALLAGLAIVVLLVHLPIVGVPFRIVATLVGAGLVTERLRAVWSERRAA